MQEELASVRGVVDLSPQEALDEAQDFLTRQGYGVAHRTATTLTVERQDLGDMTGQESVLKLVVMAVPQLEGGVRIKVTGNDREYVRNSQAQWMEWSETLAKRTPQEPQADPRETATEETEEIIAEAEGLNGRVQLLQGKVRIRREGRDAKKLGSITEFSILELASVELGSVWGGGGYIRLVPSEQEGGKARLPWRAHEVLISRSQKELFEAIRKAIEQRIQESRGPAETEAQVSGKTFAGVPGRAQGEVGAAAAAGAGIAGSKIAGGPEILNHKLRRLTDQHISEGESIQFCLRTSDPVWSQAIVALDDRLLVIKPGFMAGATFGARVTSFYYRDITGIEVNTGLMNGVIEINTPAYQGTVQRDFWNVRDENKDPYKVTNCLPITKFDLKEYKPYIDRLRTMIREAKHERPVSSLPQSEGNLSSELEKLASFRDSGVLTEEEFQKAKKRLLGL